MNDPSKMVHRSTLALAFLSLIFSIIKRLIKFAFFSGAFMAIMAVVLIVMIL